MLAFTGCSFEVRQCVLSPPDEALYDAAVTFWEELLKGIEKAVEIVGKDPSNLFRLYWASHQSFFKQVRFPPLRLLFFLSNSTLSRSCSRSPKRSPQPVSTHYLFPPPHPQRP
jgi:hypothetical protein